MNISLLGRIAGTVLTVLATGGAFAQDRWQYAGPSRDFDVYLDTATLRRTGDRVDAWFEHRYKPESEFSRSVTLLRIDCGSRMITVLSSVQYGKDAKVKFSSNSAGSPDPVIPATMGEFSWGAACPKEAEPFGLEQVRMLGERLRRDDPDFPRKFAGMSKKIEAIQAVLPPTLWASAIEYEWRKVE